MQNCSLYHWVQEEGITSVIHELKEKGIVFQIHSQFLGTASLQTEQEMATDLPECKHCCYTQCRKIDIYDKGAISFHTSYHRCKT